MVFLIIIIFSNPTITFSNLSESIQVHSEVNNSNILSNDFTLSQVSEPTIRQFQIPTNNSGPNAIISTSNNALWFVEYLAGKIGEFFPQNGSFKEFTIPEQGAVPSSLAIDGRGRIWFSDQSGVGSIWVFDPKNNSFTQFKTLSENSKPLFIIIDSENNVWFTEISSSKLGLISYPSYSMSEFALPTPNAEPAELSFGTNQSIIWITETNTGKIASFSVKMHNFLEYTPPEYASLLSPVGIVVDKSGNVWISEHGGSAVVEMTPSNSSFRKFPTSIPESAGYPISAVATLAIDSQGQLWFVEHFANKVGRLNPVTQTIEEFQIPSSELAYSVLNALDEHGNFWFTNFGANDIAEIDGNSSVPFTISVNASNIPRVSSGNSLNTSVYIQNELSTPLSISLNSSSSFSKTGITSSKEMTLTPTQLTIPAGGRSSVMVTITPDASLVSGIYSVGVVATSGNDSTIGIEFITVVGQFSLGGFLTSYYQVIIIAVILVLIGTYLMIGRNHRRTKGGSRKD